MTIAAGWWNAPSEVLALGQVDAGLAADRRIDLGDERRRDLDEPDAAQVGRGQEPGRVAERAAADGDEGSPRSTRSGASSRAAVSMTVEPLGRLALGQQDVRHVVAAIRTRLGREPLTDRRPGARLADEDRPGRRSASSSEPTAPAAIPSPQDEPADRRGGAQQRRRADAHAACRATLGEKLGDPLVHGVDPRNRWALFRGRISDLARRPAGGPRPAPAPVAQRPAPGQRARPDRDDPRPRGATRAVLRAATIHQSA